MRLKLKGKKFQRLEFWRLHSIGLVGELSDKGGHGSYAAMYLGGSKATLCGWV